MWQARIASAPASALYAGAYAAVHGGLDAFVFTAGIGEHENRRSGDKPDWPNGCDRWIVSAAMASNRPSAWTITISKPTPQSVCWPR